MTQFDAFRAALETRASELAGSSPPPRRRGRWLALGVAISVGTVGVAAAAESLWWPTSGEGGVPQATRSDRPAQAEVNRDFGVLRRKQTATDRSEAAERALSYTSTRYQGVNPTLVRVLGSTPDGHDFVLFPVERLLPAPRDPRVPHVRSNALCVFVTDVDGGSGDCYELADVSNGLASGGAGAWTWVLLPDAVDHLMVTDIHGRSVRVEVRNNLAVVRSATIPFRATARLFDANGRPVRRDDGRTTVDLIGELTGYDSGPGIRGTTTTTTTTVPVPNP